MQLDLKEFDKIVDLINKGSEVKICVADYGEPLPKSQEAAQKIQIMTENVDKAAVIEIDKRKYGRVKETAQIQKVLDNVKLNFEEDPSSYLGVILQIKGQADKAEYVLVLNKNAALPVDSTVFQDMFINNLGAIVNMDQKNPDAKRTLNQLAKDPNATVNDFYQAMKNELEKSGFADPAVKKSMEEAGSIIRSNNWENARLQEIKGFRKSIGMMNYMLEGIKSGRVKFEFGKDRK